MNCIKAIKYINFVKFLIKISINIKENIRITHLLIDIIGLLAIIDYQF